MKATTFAQAPIASSSLQATKLERLARRIVTERLRELRFGQLVIKDEGGAQSFGELTESCPLTAVICVHHPSFYSDIAFGGEIGAGEAFMRGYWSCEELETLLRILLANRQVLEKFDSGFAKLARPARKLLHWMNRNTRGGSRKNIAAHYDLGNDFYALWLDPRMMYSSAYFEKPDMSLELAATAKLERICRKLDLSESDSVIEIGSGWGGFAIYAAQRYGCHVTTTTISKQQFDLATQRIRAAGLENNITLLFQDYRDLEGSFDKLVSIEMIEAVGHHYHDTFFRKCCSLLKPDGQLLLQAITIADQQYERYKRGIDFIRRYIFPGGCLTSLTDMAKVMTLQTDLRLLHVEDIGTHYAQTLRNWRERFLAAVDTIRAQGYSEAFIRMWQYYLCYCEAAFTERAIGTVRLLAVRPEARRGQIIC